MNYSEALERQVAMLRVVQHAKRPDVLRYTHEAERRLGLPVASDQEDIGTISQIEAVLRRAEPFYWEPRLTRAMLDSAATMPFYPLHEDDLPSRAGFFWFPSPIVTADTELGPMRTHALGWDSVLWKGSGDVGITFIACGNVPHSQENIMGPQEQLDWRFGLTSPPQTALEATYPGYPKLAAPLLPKCRIFLAALAWLKQRVLVAPREHAERHARKRLEAQGWSHEPLIRVVQLRRSETRGYTPPTEHEAREWSCQWVVRGHWRQQYFPTKAEHRPIWITPHVKGPENKPLKPPRAMVFAVTR